MGINLVHISNRGGPMTTDLIADVVAAGNIVLRTHGPYLRSQQLVPMRQLQP